MTQPKAKFYAGDKVDVICDAFTIHCVYWVEWGDDHWHVKIRSVEKKEIRAEVEFEHLVKAVKEALRGSAERDISVMALEEPNQPPEPTDFGRGSS